MSESEFKKVSNNILALALEAADARVEDRRRAQQAQITMRETDCIASIRARVDGWFPQAPYELEIVGPNAENKTHYSGYTGYVKLTEVDGKECWLRLEVTAHAAPGTVKAYMVFGTERDRSASRSTSGTMMTSVNDLADIGDCLRRWGVSP